MDRSQLRTRLGDELFALVDGLPSAVLSLEPLLGRGPCASFRLMLADGQAVKAKRLPSATDAERVERSLQVLAHPAFPPVLLRRGTSILTRWVAGQQLDARESDTDIVRMCGTIHAAVHAARPTDAAARGQWRSRQQRDDWLRPALDVLVGSDWIAREEATAVLAVVERHAPEDWSTGVVHGDFNPENLIRADTGTVVAVDNETLSTGAHAFDLARTWYRWPMRPAQWAAYREGYGDGEAMREFEQQLPFWALSVLARGAAFRVRAGRPGAAEPLARLREQLELWW